MASKAKLQRLARLSAAIVLPLRTHKVQAMVEIHKHELSTMEAASRTAKYRSFRGMLARHKG